MTDIERTELMNRLDSREHDDIAGTEFNVVERLVGFPGVFEPLLSGSVEWGLRFGPGWVKKPVVYYDGRFWDVEKYAIQANQERDEKLPDWFEQVTEEQKMAWHQWFSELTVAGARKAAEDIRSGACDIWDADIGELRENDWDFPITMPVSDPFVY